MEIYYTKASTDKELQQILALQKRNTVGAISKDEREKEGFITVKHSFDILKRMSDTCPHIIAKHNCEVVGYALSMNHSYEEDIPVLAPMFKVLKSLKLENYLVMGQVCVDKYYRKQGVFRNLYATMKKEYKSIYAMLITEVDTTNTRSLGAHYAVGFKLLKTYESLGQHWNIISLHTSD